MQLLGYYLVMLVSEREPDGRYTVSAENVEEARAMSVHTYERRALKPLLDELSDTERQYLRAMSMCLDDRRLASTSDVAHMLGKEPRNLSKARSRLIDKGIIASPSHGRIMFCVPYLADYVTRPESRNMVIETALLRGV